VFQCFSAPAHEEVEKGTTVPIELTLMVPNETVICFRITKKMKEGTSIEWHKTEIKLERYNTLKTRLKELQLHITRMD
jgi:hypothetical protein